jgi:hypothetical protein
MTKYRIQVKQYSDGSKKYYVQKRWFIFWEYLPTCEDIFEDSFEFSSFGKCEDMIEALKNEELRNKDLKSGKSLKIKLTKTLTFPR